MLQQHQSVYTMLEHFCIIKVDISMVYIFVISHQGVYIEWCKIIFCVIKVNKKKSQNSILTLIKVGIVWCINFFFYHVKVYTVCMEKDYFCIVKVNTQKCTKFYLKSHQGRYSMANKFTFSKVDIIWCAETNFPFIIRKKSVDYKCHDFSEYICWCIFR